MSMRNYKYRNGVVSPERDEIAEVAWNMSPYIATRIRKPKNLTYEQFEFFDRFYSLYEDYENAEKELYDMNVSEVDHQSKTYIDKCEEILTFRKILSIMLPHAEETLHQIRLKEIEKENMPSPIAYIILIALFATAAGLIYLLANK